MVKSMYPKRGELWWVYFGDQDTTSKTRPVVIISNNFSNKYLDRYQVVPVTSNTEKVYQSETLVTVKKKSGKVMADQIATISAKRMYKKIGTVSSDEIAAIEHVLKLQLGLT